MKKELIAVVVAVVAAAVPETIDKDQEENESKADIMMVGEICIVEVVAPAAIDQEGGGDEFASQAAVHFVHSSMS